MSVQIAPEDVIGFERPLTRVVKQSISIKNPNDKPIAFKVKTTAPKLYCVRPNSDIIPAHGSIDVSIMLQAQREEPPLDAKCRDKFLILSTFISPATASMELQDLWTYVEGKEKGSIHQRKLKCVYTQPGEEVGSRAKSVPVTAPVQTEPLASGKLSTPAAPATAATAVVAPAPATGSSDEVLQKMKQMEAELSKYKKEVETLRQSEPQVIEKVQVKNTGYPLSIMILVALMMAAVAYFVKS